MPTFKSFSASIVVEGKHLNEYNVETSSNANGLTIVTCWIPSEAGKKYEVNWTDSYFKHPSDGQVYVDGHYCGGKVLRRKNEIMNQKGIRESPTSVKLFQFSLLNMTDNDETSMIDMPRDIGQIKLRIQYWQLPKAGDGGLYKGQSVPSEQIFNEKAKKGIDHQTRFFETATTKPAYNVGGKALGKCFLEFHFRYRPLDVLRAHGIAPPPPPSAASPASQSGLGKRRRSPVHEDLKPQVAEVIEILDDEDEDPRKEIARLQARLDELRTRHPDTRDRKKIKHDPDAIRVKMEHPMSGPLFIDLT
ncbi:hypothetical protein GYMLUDRAFT_87643 [Collybiopsis luxurians FD-317 M1]|uniref:DUF7918 domain-containing protein n=1 Tax=Collybiopsis luxurians FD-317 M1 TaxID=944289 RepID=A0A0D0CK91_9AGAR|nr:hypothetical protein GYMLUDRAFT_87643 [Collybiopsis luxurians FD-317 M1]